MSTLELVRLPGSAPIELAPTELAPTELAPTELAPLSRRELVILGHLDEGVTLAEIATTLFVTRNTVKSQVRSLYRKIGASSRVEAITWAQSAGLR